MPDEAKKVNLLKLLSRSIAVLEEALSSENEVIKVGTARYIVDQVMGKPTQRVEDTGRELAAGTAAALAQTLRHVLTSPPPPQEINFIEGAIHILPPGEEPDKFDDFPEE